MSSFLTDLEIANQANKKHINDIAKQIDVPEEALIVYGNDKAKINYDFLDKCKNKKDGKLILVTAISPTPAGEGKTTTSVGLVDGLCHNGKKAMICLREPSLGPCFGMKGGAAGGGYAQVVPMTDINLHFTGDFHAIGAAHNLLSALIDNHIHWENDLNIDPRRITWKRVVDMNDRSLRDITCGLGGTGNGIPRQSGFDITVASEIMAVFCLASDLEDLENRIGNIVFAYTRKLEPVRVHQLKAQGALTALLRDAFQPNLVQTLENNPALMHGGPFANIAHGCNSVIATKTALKLADYVVTEAGFGADLGAEKFFDIKCRKAGLSPDAVVLVATTKALKMHGGVKKEDLKVVTKKLPNEDQINDLLFAWKVAKHTKSNAIIYAKNLQTAGIGAGQMSRIDSTNIANEKAKKSAAIANLNEPLTIGSVVASDAFFPFPDGLIAAADAGVTAVIQPGGSIKDKDVIAAADKRGLVMVFTSIRHFKH